MAVFLPHITGLSQLSEWSLSTAMPNLLTLTLRKMMWSPASYSISLYYAPFQEHLITTTLCLFLSPGPCHRNVKPKYLPHAPQYSWLARCMKNRRGTQTEKQMICQLGNLELCMYRIPLRYLRGQLELKHARGCLHPAVRMIYKNGRPSERPVV